MIEVKPVASKAEQKAFIQFPHEIYADNQYWVAPLNPDMWDWARKKHPFFEYGDMEWYLAYRDGKIVGRISTSSNKLFNEHNNENAGFFGFFECINDQEVANAMLDKAKEVNTARGFEKMMGPCSPSPNHDFGLLIDGFDDPPRIMSTYNPPYYENLFKGYGLNEANQLYAYKMDRATVEGNEKLERGVELVKKRYGVTLRTFEKKHIKREVKLIQEIWNKAWVDNWGHVPFTDGEIQKLEDDFKLLVDPELILYAELDGKCIGMLLALPDYNEKIIDFKGKLFPFNFLKLLFGKKDYKWMRIVLLGILPEYQRKGIDALFFHETIKTGIRRGMQFGDASWVLADNDMMNRAMKLANAKVYKRWGVYDLPLN